jgi:hypothetical protein
MWHKFPYLEVFPVDHGDAFPGVDRVIRPALNIKLKYDGREESFKALVDSGADFCVFPLALAGPLGLRREDAKLVPGISGYGSQNGSPLLFWIVTLEISTDLSITTLIGFSEAQDRLDFGILGQRGFFSELEQVSFAYGGGGFALRTPDAPLS